MTSTIGGRQLTFRPAHVAWAAVRPDTCEVVSEKICAEVSAAIILYELELGIPATDALTRPVARLDPEQQRLGKPRQQHRRWKMIEGGNRDEYRRLQR